MAPIAITVFNRFNHLQTCISKLLECPEARDTDLFISSDFPKNEIDIPIILEIRKFIKKLSLTNKCNFLNKRQKAFEGFLPFDRVVRSLDCLCQKITINSVSVKDTKLSLY